MIGDSTHDLKAAKAAQIYAVGVLTGVAEKKELEPYADNILDSIEKIPFWLK
jgi:phosphoglycolate phosphatase